MPIVLKESGDFVQAPEGSHVAICIRIADVGTQPDSGFGPKRKIIVTWELCNEMVEIDGGMKPMTVSKYYTYTLNKQGNLRQDLERWRNRAFTKDELKAFGLNAILHKPCQLSIIHNEDGKARVDVVMSLPKGTQVPKPVHGAVEYTIEDGRNDTYKALPEWLRKLADQCEEWKKPQPKPAPSAPQTDSPPAFEEDIPF